MAGKLYGYNTMLNYKQLYKCIYSLECNDDLPKVVISEDYDAACFSRLYASKPLGSSASYRVPEFTFSLIVCTSTFFMDNNYSNMCLLEEDEIIEYLEDIKRLFKEPSEFTYKISDGKDMIAKSKYLEDAEDCIKITVTLTKTSWFFIKFISHALRFLEEYPVNMVLREAMTLRRLEPKYQQYPILSIFGFVYSAFGRNTHSFTPLSWGQDTPSSRYRHIIVPYSYREFTKICNTPKGDYDEVGKVWRTQEVSKSPFTKCSTSWDSLYIKDYLDKLSIPKKRVEEYNQAFELVT